MKGLSKIVFRVLLLFALVTIALPLGASCTRSEKEEGVGGAESTKLEAMAVVADCLISAELATYELLEIFSEGYTEPLFGRDVEISTEDYNAIFEIMEDISAREEDVTLSWDILTSNASKTSSSPLNSPFPFFSPQPVYASPGLVGAVLEFFDWAKGGGERSRGRILEAAEMALQKAGNKETVKQEMFDAIPDAHRGGAENWDAFEEKLKGGELDNKTHRIYNNLCNYSPEFGDAATDVNKGKHPIMAVAHEEGAKGLETGSKLYVEAAKTAVGSGLPGLKDGFEKAEDVIEKAEKVEQYVKDTYEKGLDGLKESVKDALEDKVGDILEEGLGENTADAVTFIARKAAAKAKVADIIEGAADTEKGLDEASGYLRDTLGLGTAILTDSDEESKANVALAIDEKTGYVVVYVGDPEKDPFFLPEGEFDITVLDSEGKSDESSGVKIAAGQGTVVIVDTGEEEKPYEDIDSVPEITNTKKVMITEEEFHDLFDRDKFENINLVKNFFGEPDEVITYEDGYFSYVYKERIKMKAGVIHTVIFRFHDSEVEGYSLSW